MNNIFLDSNICIYTFDKSTPQKQKKGFDLLKERPCISSQVVIESYNACFKKLDLPQTVCEESVLYLVNICRIIEIKGTTIRSAIAIARRYHFSFLDSMIVSSAFDAHCSILYSEDMQHKQVIENPEQNGVGKLTIINPFII